MWPRSTSLASSTPEPSLGKREDLGETWGRDCPNGAIFTAETEMQSSYAGQWMPHFDSCQLNCYGCWEGYCSIKERYCILFLILLHALYFWVSVSFFDGLNKPERPGTEGRLEPIGSCGLFGLVASRIDREPRCFPWSHSSHSVECPLSASLSSALGFHKVKPVVVSNAWLVWSYRYISQM